MQHNLYKSERFKQELEFYRVKISKILSPAGKKQAQDLLEKIYYEANQINEGHASNQDGNLNIHGLKDNVANLQSLRHQLNQYLKGT